MVCDKNVRKICALCLHGRDFGTDGVLCDRRGPVSPDDCCHRFIYDPLRRRPPAGANIKKPPAEAFKL
ncbi:MAG: hypothetical protein VB086_06550 [Clostridiaceae bacterium]|nr:hypothetical protein [Clostridiaceae bacterium]